MDRHTVRQEAHEIRPAPVVDALATGALGVRQLPEVDLPDNVAHRHADWGALVAGELASNVPRAEDDLCGGQLPAEGL